MTEQTFLTEIIDKNEKTIDFERWPYKKLSTVKKKALELHNSMMKHSWYARDMAAAEFLVISKGNYHTQPVCRIQI